MWNVCDIIHAVKTGAEYLNGESKRKLDVASALAIGLPLMPLTVTGLMSALVDNKFKEPFYSQVRRDGQGRPFIVTKFRTLPVGSDKSAAAYGAYDPRASKAGKILRWSGIDETPQLANVLQGSMSFLGVRAYNDDGFNRLQMTSPKLFDIWYEEAYGAGKPALVSLSQIFKRGFSDTTSTMLEDGMLIDLDYVKNASLVRDMQILGSLPLKLLMPSLIAPPPVSVDC